MSKITKPMLAVTLKDWNKLDFKSNRYFASPKFDGIRALCVNGEIVSRTFKPIRNNHVRTILEEILPEGADGEILIGDGTSFQKTSSGVMSEEGTPDFIYYMFDLVTDDTSKPYGSRTAAITEWYECKAKSLRGNDILKHVKPVIPVEIKSKEELYAYEEKCLAENYEGVILRTFDGPYKCGRATEKQQWMLKIKRFTDDEAVIIGFVEKFHNDNEATKDAFGHTVRSSHKENKRPAGTLGALIVKDIKTDIEFEVGTGFSDEVRQEIWDNQNSWMSKIIKYKHFSVSGVKTRPRFPAYIGVRDPEDM